MKIFTAKDIHQMEPGFYWFCYPADRADVDILRIFRNEFGTHLGFDYPDQTAVGIDKDPGARVDLQGIQFIGPIPEPSFI